MQLQIRFDCWNCIKFYGKTDKNTVENKGSIRFESERTELEFSFLKFYLVLV